MEKNETFNLEYTYLSLPSIFYQLVKPASLSEIKMVIFNKKLSEELQITYRDEADIVSFLKSYNKEKHYLSFAQAYAGHQFGNFAMLGDGRTIMLGEFIDPKKNRFDLQLKGGGRTQFSRGGDGKATLKSMLREYLISEAMHFMDIPTSRSLFVAKTGESIQREVDHEGAVLARIMRSHIRIGTFEFARNFGTKEDLETLTKYTVNRLHPEIEKAENLALGLLQKVITIQIDLVVNWMRVGFIHGVMNTDNTSISGETFDYGPCAFMNTYDPQTVFSSIDRGSRYAFGNQSKIIKWNIARFAEALLPILNPEPKIALDMAQQCLNEFDEVWMKSFYQMQLRKLGLENGSAEFYFLVDELFALMQTLKLDYTNTFRMLMRALEPSNDSTNTPELKSWMEKWKNVIKQKSDFEKARKIMHDNNPAFIPRNHLVEEALSAAIDGDFNLYNELLKVLSTPYEHHENYIHFTLPSDAQFEKQYATYCGT